MRLLAGMEQREKCLRKFKEYIEVEGLQIDLEKELHTAEELVESTGNARHGRHLTLIVDPHGRHKKTVTVKFGEQEYHWEIETSDRERRYFIDNVLKNIDNGAMKDTIRRGLKNDMSMVESGLSSSVFRGGDNNLYGFLGDWDVAYGIANKDEGDICAFVIHPQSRTKDCAIYMWKAYMKGITS